VELIGSSPTITPPRYLRLGRKRSTSKSRSAAAYCRAHTVLAAMNKCLSQSNKSAWRGGAESINL